MSALAGVVSLKPKGLVSPHYISLMLESMKPKLSCSIDNFSLPCNEAIIGKLSYGADNTDTKEITDSENEFHVFMIGELYNDDLQKWKSGTQYIAERYAQFGPKGFLKNVNGSFFL